MQFQIHRIVSRKLSVCCRVFFPALSGKCSRQRNIGRHHANPIINKRRKWTSQENKIVMECYLLSKPMIRGYRKRILSLWLRKGMFWVSEQRLVDQANAIRRNSWMTEIEIQELEKKVTGNGSVIVEEVRSVEALADHVGEDVRNVLPKMGAEEQASNRNSFRETYGVSLQIIRKMQSGCKTCEVKLMLKNRRR